MNKEKVKTFYSIYSYHNITEDHLRFDWWYIGRAKGKNKIREHRNDNRINNSISKLGPDLRNPNVKFDRRVLWTGLCTLTENKQMERDYIVIYMCKTPNGYNQNHGGGGVGEHTEKTRKKMSRNNAMNRPEVRKKTGEAIEKAQAKKHGYGDDIESWEKEKAKRKSTINLKLSEIHKESSNRPEMKIKEILTIAGLSHTNKAAIEYLEKRIEELKNRGVRVRCPIKNRKKLIKKFQKWVKELKEGKIIIVEKEKTPINLKRSKNQKEIHNRPDVVINQLLTRAGLPYTNKVAIEYLRQRLKYRKGMHKNSEVAKQKIGNLQRYLKWLDDGGVIVDLKPLTTKIGYKTAGQLKKMAERHNITEEKYVEYYLKRFPNRLAKAQAKLEKLNQHF